MPEPTRKTAMLSSTSLDLPEHRKEAMDACLRQGIFPRAMEHLPARAADAISVSLQMVDEADIYIGIYAWRYGYVPAGHDLSITEMEFNRAVERGMPILAFTIHHNHPLTITMVEADKEAQEKLTQLKERVCHGRGRLEFTSPVDLRSHIIQSLSALLREEEAVHQEKGAPSFHLPNRIPAAPAPYIAHPYSLLQTREMATQVFLSYVRQNALLSERLKRALESYGITTWLDRIDLSPGKRWEREIHRAISHASFFIACFSAEYSQRTDTYMNAELRLAIERLHRLPIDSPWLIPVKFAPCELPEFTIGSGQVLSALQCVNLYPDWDAGVSQLAKAIHARQSDINN